MEDDEVEAESAGGDVMGNGDADDDDLWGEEWNEEEEAREQQRQQDEEKKKKKKTKKEWVKQEPRVDTVIVDSELSPRSGRRPFKHTSSRSKTFINPFQTRVCFIPRQPPSDFKKRKTRFIHHPRFGDDVCVD